MKKALNVTLFLLVVSMLLTMVSCNKDATEPDAADNSSGITEQSTITIASDDSKSTEPENTDPKNTETEDKKAEVPAEEIVFSDDFSTVKDYSSQAVTSPTLATSGASYTVVDGKLVIDNTANVATDDTSLLGTSESGSACFEVLAADIMNKYAGSAYTIEWKLTFLEKASGHNDYAGFFLTPNFAGDYGNLLMPVVRYLGGRNYWIMNAEGTHISGITMDTIKTVGDVLGNPANILNYEVSYKISVSEAGTVEFYANDTLLCGYDGYESYMNQGRGIALIIGTGLKVSVDDIVVTVNPEK